MVAGEGADTGAGSVCCAVGPPDGQCEQALLIWDQLAASGLELSVQGYTTAISACAPLQAPDRAAALFRAMRADGLVADCAAYTALIRAHASQGQWQRATKVHLLHPA